LQVASQIAVAKGGIGKFALGESSILIWLLMTGSWPIGEVDHQNLDSLDNSWANLRLATHQQNTVNRPPRADNKLGLKGVKRRKNRFIARITVDYREIYLGIFDNADDAAAAYDKAARNHHGEFARVNSMTA
jgi:phosphotransferase system IIB component